MGIKKRYVLLLVLFLFQYLHLLNIVPLLLDRHEGEGGAYVDDGGDRDGNNQTGREGKGEILVFFSSLLCFILFRYSNFHFCPLLIRVLLFYCRKGEGGLDANDGVTNVTINSTVGPDETGLKKRLVRFLCFFLKFFVLLVLILVLLYLLDRHEGGGNIGGGEGGGTGRGGGGGGGGEGGGGARG